MQRLPGINQSTSLQQRPSVQTISSSVIRAAPTRYQSINFSTTATLCSDNKFKCDTCGDYQLSINQLLFNRDPLFRQVLVWYNQSILLHRDLFRQQFKCDTCSAYNVSSVNFTSQRPVQATSSIVCYNLVPVSIRQLLLYICRIRNLLRISLACPNM